MQQQAALSTQRLSLHRGLRTAQPAAAIPQPRRVERSFTTLACFCACFRANGPRAHLLPTCRRKAPCRRKATSLRAAMDQGLDAMLAPTLGINPNALEVNACTRKSLPLLRCQRRDSAPQLTHPRLTGGGKQGPVRPGCSHRPLQQAEAGTNQDPGTPAGAPPRQPGLRVDTVRATAQTDVLCAAFAHRSC